MSELASDLPAVQPVADPVSLPSEHAPERTSSPVPAAMPRFTWMDFWLLVLMIVWGSNIALLKSLIQELSPFVMNGLRFSMAALVLLIIFKAQHIKLTLPRREWPMLIWITFAGQVLYQVIWLYSLKQTTVANNALILTTVPVWVVLFNAWRGHERISRTGVLGILLAIAGVCAVIISGGGVSFGGSTITGDLLTLVAALIWAGVLLMSRRPYKRNPPMPVAFWNVAWGALFQFMFVLFDPSQITAKLFQPQILLAVLFSGAVSIGLGNMIWTRAINILGTGRPAVYTYIEIIAAAGAAVIFLGEALTIWLVFGGVLVVAGVLLVKSG